MESTDHAHAEADPAATDRPRGTQAPAESLQQASRSRLVHEFGAPPAAVDEAIARLERDGKRSRIPDHRLLSSIRESGGGYRDARKVSRKLTLHQRRGALILPLLLILFFGGSIVYDLATGDGWSLASRAFFFFPPIFLSFRFLWRYAHPQHLEIDDHRVVGFDGEGQPIEIARDDIAYVDSLPSGDRAVSKRLGQHALLTPFHYLDWSHCLFVRLHDGRTIVIAQGLEGPTARAACALLEDHLGLLAPEPRRPRARIETEPAVDDDEAEPARRARAATSASVAPEADTD